ncbi:MAG: protoporphyrinogen oxidase, partial [Prevotellaceae bacterium]|nr:protoporphyrinogen oxidase [Prevotellaceae bacterium]
MNQTDIAIIGAGLTGLTTAFRLRSRDLVVLERQPRTGGQIHTHRADGFTFESGPNTGVVSYPEVAELFADLAPACRLEEACPAAKRRLIWKGNRFHQLPSGLASAVTTSLFTFRDKLNILGEPWRPKGTDPDESVGALARRRLGRSFVDYAVDPFLSGIYAGDPDTLVTRYALPKLYNLEQQYGSF